MRISLDEAQRQAYEENLEYLPGHNEEGLNIRSGLTQA